MPRKKKMRERKGQALTRKDATIAAEDFVINAAWSAVREGLADDAYREHKWDLASAIRHRIAAQTEQIAQLTNLNLGTDIASPVYAGSGMMTTYLDTDPDEMLSPMLANLKQHGHILVNITPWVFHGTTPGYIVMSYDPQADAGRSDDGR